MSSFQKSTKTSVTSLNFCGPGTGHWKFTNFPTRPMSLFSTANAPWIALYETKTLSPVLVCCPIIERKKENKSLKPSRSRVAESMSLYLPRIHQKPEKGFSVLMVLAVWIPSPFDGEPSLRFLWYHSPSRSLLFVMRDLSGNTHVWVSVLWWNILSCSYCIPFVFFCQKIFPRMSVFPSLCRE